MNTTANITPSNITTEHGIETCEVQPPEGWVIVDVYSPHTTPWDCYGNKHQREYMRVLKNSNISCVATNVMRTNLCPHGSGPNGCIRFGDEMMPATYRIAVCKLDETNAIFAFQEHCKAIQAWLDSKRPMPEALR